MELGDPHKVCKIIIFIWNEFILWFRLNIINLKRFKLYISYRKNTVKEEIDYQHWSQSQSSKEYKSREPNPSKRNKIRKWVGDNTLEFGSRIEKKIVNIGTKHWKPAKTWIWFESSVNDPSNKIILIHHKPYWSYTSMNIDCDQESVSLHILSFLILLMLQQHCFLWHTPLQHFFLFAFSKTQMKWNKKSDKKGQY